MANSKRLDADKQKGMLDWLSRIQKKDKKEFNISKILEKYPKPTKKQDNSTEQAQNL